MNFLSLIELKREGKIQLNQQVTLSMLGGDVVGCLNEHEEVILKARAHCVFSGSI